MNDREKTSLLTKLGFLVLRSMGCMEVSTEVNIPLWLTGRLDDFHNAVIDNSRHHIIDVLGVQWEYLPPSKLSKGVKKRLILRGIEVKVSRGDLKNGFIHVGCHYNYLMVPKGLVSVNEVHKDIGIIEVDLENYRVRKWGNSFVLEGVKLIRNPKRKTVEDKLVERCRDEMSTTLTNQTKRWLVEFMDSNA